MKAVWSWMLELCELGREISHQEGAQALTDLGLEVEGIEVTGEGVQGVIVGEVAWKKKHPNADKLTLVGVRDEPGGDVTDVVCGADNVPDEGGRVVWARPGSTLPGGFQIGTKKLKGIESAGMLCAEDELGISDDHGGIIVLDGTAEIGSDARQALGLGEVVFDVGIPANRADCLGHLGLARELVATIGGRIEPWASPLDDLESAQLRADDLVRVDIEDPEACPRYIARVIDGVKVGPSPRWMQQRLRAVGVRPLSNLVDVTNYVMFELGQPLHAFDYPTVRGQRIVVRKAGDAITSMKTLDDIERKLDPADLLICDGEGPVALAGVMGGLESEVHEGTTRVLLESAGFEPIGIRRTGRRLGLHSESSHRFERGVDVDGAERASQRAAQLIAELGGGVVASGKVDAYPRPVEPRPVSMRVSRASQLTGVEFEADEAKATLDRLGLQASGDRDQLSVLVPTHRGDLEREVDLIEELIRLHGYDNVPATLPVTTHSPDTGGDPRWAVREALTAAGLSEAITFGFTSPERIAAMRFAEGDRRATPIGLQNPMSVEQSVMRTSLLPNLLGAVSRNLKYGIVDIGLFEIGTVFLRSQATLPDEPLHIAGVLCGTRRGWLEPPAAVDFFDIKGALASVFDVLDLDWHLRANARVGHLHPGVGAAVIADDEVLGSIGEIHPQTREAFDIEVPVFGFELVLGGRLALPRRQMRPIANHPAVTRDISFFVDESVPAARVRDLIDDVGEGLVESVEILEDYRDPAHVPEGKKGLLWSITYRASDRTLTDKEVDKAHAPIVDKLLTELDAQQR